MAANSDISAWIALFTGLYLLAAAAGELRAPGGWARMVAEFLASPALRTVTGAFCLAIGATLYLVNPWLPGNWLAMAVSVLGGVVVAEGLLLLAAGDRYLLFAQRLLGNGARARGWAGFAAILGAAAIIAATARL